MKKIMPLAYVLTLVLFIGIGFYMVYKPLGFISVGLLMWLDLNIQNWRTSNK